MTFKSAFHSLSEEEFSKYYEEYEYIANRDTDLSSDSINFIINHLGANKEISIVDIGCGSGYVLRQIYKNGYKNILGVDLVPKTVNDDFKIEAGNIENLSFPDGYFDTVICNHTLEHVLDLPKAINELKRIAKKKLIITVPCQRYYRYTFDLHIHFFSQISYLLKYINLPDSQIEYHNIKGDWSVVCSFEK